MTKDNPKYRLLVFLILVLAGLLLGTMASILPPLIEGISFQELTNNPQKIQELSAGGLRLTLFINHLFLFLLPSFVYGVYFFGRKFISGFDLDKRPGWYLIFGILLLYICYPLVNLAHFININLPLADWMIEDENQIANTIEKIIGTKNPLTVFINILLIAVMPAIGEELVFRGIIQKNLAKWTKSPHIGIWIAAFLFSAIHFQFQGFLARMVLGAILGYSYYWTRNFWIPVLLHFLNNLLPLLSFVILDIDLTDTSELEASPQLWTLLITILGAPALYYFYKKIHGKQRV